MHWQRWATSSQCRAAAWAHPGPAPRDADSPFVFPPAGPRLAAARAQLRLRGIRTLELGKLSETSGPPGPRRRVRVTTESRTVTRRPGPARLSQPTLRRTRVPARQSNFESDWTVRTARGRGPARRGPPNHGTNSDLFSSLQYWGKTLVIG
eukprot:767530-Hanusia_phi.AAC.3